MLNIFRIGFSGLTIAKLIIAMGCVLILFGHSATWTGNNVRIQKYFFNPQARVNLLEKVPVIEKIKNLHEDPFRSISIGNVVFSGYRATAGLESLDGPDALQSKEYKILINLLGLGNQNAWDWRMEFDLQKVEKFKKALNLLGVDTIFSPYEISNAPWLLPIAAEDRLYAYHLKGAWPRAFFSNKLHQFSSNEEFLQIFQDQNGPFIAIDKRTVEKSPKLNIIQNEGVPALIQKATAYKLTSNKTSFDIITNQPGFIYIGEVYEEGSFKATLNGKLVEPYLANYAFKVIPVSVPGTYNVTLSYWPAHFSTYLMSSAIGFILLVLTLILRKKNEIN